MLHDFLTSHQAELIDRCRSKVVQRRAPAVTDAELRHGIPLFLRQLANTLRVEQTAEPLQGVEVSGPPGSGATARSELGETAARHGHELLQHGFTIGQVVHDYGDLCQAIMELADERGVPIEVDEFRTLNRCLDHAIADAVTEFSYHRDVQREHAVAENGSQVLNERFGALAHELRNLIQTATLAVTAIKGGHVGLAGATGAVLERSLMGMRKLVELPLADIRATAGLPPRPELIAVAGFISEVGASMALEAQARECSFTVSAVEPQLAVEADRGLLLSAVGNLLHNAFKFTARGTAVSLNAYAAADRVRIDVEDNCGGLPPGDAEKLFLPFTQDATDRSGLGLGLSISRRSVETSNGVLSVRDIPGKGCVFTIDLPRRALQ